eukprot:1861025-Rhodomonas_salina.1
MGAGTKGPILVLSNLVRAVWLAKCGKRDGVGEIECGWTKDGVPVTWHRVVSVPGTQPGLAGAGQPAS